MAGEGAKGFVFEPGGIGAIFKANRLRVPTFSGNTLGKMSKLISY